mmetsp:Transcript_2275/g.4103  ORF Transcript_2275/g.4103 Transcript_2275/m.4103 type:complete len:122 (+) Transcript_2275:66-431(+)
MKEGEGDSVGSELGFLPGEADGKSLVHLKVEYSVVAMVGLKGQYMETERDCLMVIYLATNLVQAREGTKAMLKQGLLSVGCLRHRKYSGFSIKEFAAISHDFVAAHDFVPSIANHRMRLQW